jgi:SAM-dependent methyltransferase
VAACSESDPVSLYLEQGERFSRALLSLFPADLPLDGERALDFGCGSGRFLRYLIKANTGAVFEGCDIHEPSIEWLRRHLPAPHDAFVNDPEPPLPRPDGCYKLIYATSVFTHLTESWASWLCELHRLLANDGMLIATVLSAACGAQFVEQPWHEERIGMLVLGPGRPWEAGGPMVLHSEWWLRLHWGRAFEIHHFDAGDHSGFDGQGVVVMRKRNVRVGPQQLDAIEPGEPRELTALTHALHRAHAELIELNARHDEYSCAYQQEAAAREQLENENEALRREAEALRKQLPQLSTELADARRARNAARTIVRAVDARARLLARRLIRPRQ